MIGITEAVPFKREPRSVNPCVHLRNLLTHTLLFWYFLSNLNVELKNILEYIRTMFSGNTCLFLDTSDLELLWKFELKNFKKTKVANLRFFKQINAKNKIAICHCNPFL